MKEKLTPRWFVINLTGLLFAGYSAYNVFVIFKTAMYGLPEKFISGVVALLFALLAAYAFTSGVKNTRFLMVRRVIFIIVLSAVFALKIRMVVRVIEFMDFSVLFTVFYGAAYFFTQVALLIMLFYYAFIRKSFYRYPKVSIILMIITMLLFIGSFAFEAILLFEYGLFLEPSVLRTLVSRPLFYLGFIGLTVNFMFPLQEGDDGFVIPDDSELIAPDDDEYVPPEIDESVEPDRAAFVMPDDGEYIPPERAEFINSHDPEFVVPDGDEIPPEGIVPGRPDDSGFIMRDDPKYIPPDKAQWTKPDDAGFIMSDDEDYIPRGKRVKVKPDDSGFIMHDDG